MKSSLLLAAYFFATVAAASSPKLVDVNLSKAFVPIGFDDNDRAQVVAAGQFIDTCYQVGPHEIHVDEVKKKITINQKAYLYGGVCIDVLVPYHVTIDLDILEEGEYRIFDGASKSELGTLPVAKATNPGVGSDDHPYAPVNEAFVLKNSETGGHDLVLRGMFTNRCMKFRKIEVKYQNDVVVVLPIVEKVGERCGNRLVPFEKRVALQNLEKRAYLFHVRSMDGQAVNKLFSFMN